MKIDLAQAGMLLVISFLAATFGAFLLAALHRNSARQREAIFSDTYGGTTFLFDGEILIDSTPAARALLALIGLNGTPWMRLQAYLTPRFPDFETQLMRLQHEGRLMLATGDEMNPALVLKAESRGGLTRITLLDPEEQTAAPGHDIVTEKAVQDELAQLRDIMVRIPSIIWREGPGGEVIWANSAYLDHAIDRLKPGQDLSWPLPRLFDKIASMQGISGQRLRLTQADQPDIWFDILCQDSEAGRLFIGQPVNALVQAETALRDFTQTLTKTFAHLPIGLAIFDRQRQLALFNPAMLDLSGLPPDFLSMRPTLFALLDAMRDRNMIPEPKDYHAWRKQMAEIERAASSGHFEETWALPSGQTYRIIGRPHPNGALALMFEDISTEVSQMRRYRADLELSQSVVDSVDQALAVFSPAGLLVMTNAAYNQLWSHEPAASLGAGSFTVLCDHWRSRTGPSALWAESERFAAETEARTAVTGAVRLLDGRLLECCFSTLAGGSTLARFKIVSPGPEITDGSQSLMRA